METVKPQSPLSSSSLSSKYYEEEQCQHSSSSSPLVLPTANNNNVSEEEDIIKNFISFKKECAKLGISLEEVNDAAKQSVSFYKKWWWSADNKNNKNNNNNNNNTTTNNHGTNDNNDEKNDDEKSHSSSQSIHNVTGMPAALAPPIVADLIVQAKTEALIALRRSNGDTTCSHFQCAVRALSTIFSQNSRSPVNIHKFEGEWLTLSRPNFPNCLGQNVDGDFLYTLGRMSFDMFRPANLRCSIKKTVVNTTEVPLSILLTNNNSNSTTPPSDSDSDSDNDNDNIHLDHLAIPWTLRKEITKLVEQRQKNTATNNNDSSCNKEQGTKVSSPLWTFDIVTYFVVEPRDTQVSETSNKKMEEETKQQDSSREECIAPSKPLKAKMTNYGYIIPNLNIQNQFSIWFTGGVVAPASASGNKADNKRSPERKKNKKNIRGHNTSSTTFDKPSTSSSCDDTDDTTLYYDAYEQEQCIPVDTGISSPPSVQLTEGIMTTITCPLPLQECRLRNKHCALHGGGVQRMSRKNRNAVSEKLASRYNRRPSHVIRNYNFLLAQQKQQLQQHSPHSNMEWEDIFAPEDNWKRTMGEYAKALAAKAFLGAEVPDHMEDDGSMKFRLNRPISGHIDVLYMDDDIRITKGNYGTIFVHVRNTIYKKLSSTPTK